MKAINEKSNIKSSVKCQSVFVVRGVRIGDRICLVVPYFVNTFVAELSCTFYIKYPYELLKFSLALQWLISFHCFSGRRAY